MPLTEPIEAFHIRAIPGQDTKTRSTLLETKGITVSKNTRYDTEVGSVVKRDQLGKYNTSTTGTDGFHSLFRYYTKTDKKLLGATGTIMKIGDDTANSFSNLSTGYQDNKKFTFVVHRDLCIFSNGFDAVQQTDGAVVWELGGCKIVEGSGTGITKNNVSYKISMDEDQYITGAISNELSSVSNKSIDLSNIPLGPIGTLDRTIWRKDDTTGGDYKFVFKIEDNITQTYTDITATVAGAAVIPVTTDPYPKGKYLQMYRERLLISGDPDNPNTIYYSNAFLPHFLQAVSNLDFIEVSPDDGDIIVGIPILLGTVQVFKRNNIRKWHIDASGTASLCADNNFVDDPVSFVGCPAPYSIVQSPYGIVYQGWDHIYNYTGAASQPIVPEFDLLEDVNPDTLTETVGFWHDNVYLLSYEDSTDGTGFKDRVLRYHWLQQAVGIDVIGVDSFTAFKGAAEAGELYYGSSVDGFVFIDTNVETSTLIGTKTNLNLGTHDDTAVEGTEEDPVLTIGNQTTINNASGTINAASGSIQFPDTSGTYTSKAFNIKASGESMGKIYWNETLTTGDDIIINTRTASSEGGLSSASYSSDLTAPSGSKITSTADDWFQFRVVFTADDTTSTGPEITLEDGYNIKFTHKSALTLVTDNVDFVFETGFRNFGRPHSDKVFKKIITEHSGTAGNFVLTWTTDGGDTSSWTVDLTVNPNRFEAFFPSTAYGREIKFKIQKNDTNAFRLREIQGLWTEKELII